MLNEKIGGDLQTLSSKLRFKTEMYIKKSRWVDNQIRIELLTSDSELNCEVPRDSDP